MRSLRKLIGVVLLAIVASLWIPAVLADGPQESPGITSTGPQESPGIISQQEIPGINDPQESSGLMIDLFTYLASVFIP